MTKEIKNELLKSVEKIRGYRVGFEFTIYYSEIPTQAKLNALHWVLEEAVRQNLIISVAIGLSFEDIRGESGRFCSEETFRRI